MGASNRREISPNGGTAKCGFRQRLIMLILNRMLKIDAEGHHTDVPVKVYLPVDMGHHWECEYEIGWPDNARRSKGHGIDSIQSLLITLQKIGIEIYTSKAHESGKLRWLEQGDGYGFPLHAGHLEPGSGIDGELTARSSCWPK